MSNGTGQSKAPYIIICAGRIDALAAKNNPRQILVAASNAAMNLTAFYDQMGMLKVEDSGPVSALQHSMMNVLPTVQQAEAEQMANDMFTMLDEMEKRYARNYTSAGSYAHDAHDDTH